MEPDGFVRHRVGMRRTTQQHGAYVQQRRYDLGVDPVQALALPQLGMRLFGRPASQTGRRAAYSSAVEVVWGQVNGCDLAGLRAIRMTLSLKRLPRNHRGQGIGVNGILPEFV